MDKPINATTFHLEVENMESTYFWQEYLAALTARHHNPSTRIFLGSDSATFVCLRKGAHSLLSIAKTLILGEFVDESPVARSCREKVRVPLRKDNTV